MKAPGTHLNVVGAGSVGVGGAHWSKSQPPPPTLQGLPSPLITSSLSSVSLQSFCCRNGPNRQDLLVSSDKLSVSPPHLCLRLCALAARACVAHGEEEMPVVGSSVWAPPMLWAHRPGTAPAVPGAPKPWPSSLPSSPQGPLGNEERGPRRASSSIALRYGPQGMHFSFFPVGFPHSLPFPSVFLEAQRNPQEG